jgi:hypothetical protein
MIEKLWFIYTLRSWNCDWLKNDAAGCITCWDPGPIKFNYRLWGMAMIELAIQHTLILGMEMVLLGLSLSPISWNSTR